MIGRLFVGAVLVVFAAVISFLSLKYFTAPYLWAALSWASVFVCALVLVPRAKMLWLGLIVLACLAAGAESLAWISDNRVFADIKKAGTFVWVSHEILGYTATRGVAQTEAQTYRGEKLYDVTYTMNANGLRITPPSTRISTDGKRCVLFFGDSFTFGWGLNDQDTMPYRVGVKSVSKYAVYNLAFLTHGPQQMLAALEHDLVEKAVDCNAREIKYVIYQTTPDHVRRAAGLRDRVDLHHGPQYTLESNGQVSYQGQFGSNPSAREKLERALSKSSLYRKLAGGNAIYSRSYRPEDVTLFLAIVDSARARVKSTYPDSEFHVLFWGNDVLDEGGTLAKEMLKGLGDKGLTVHRVNDILPGSDQFKAEYFLGGFDLHPNPGANERIADYVVRSILKR
jgi:hypothetical protein